MGILERLFSKQPRPPTPAEEIGKLLDRFTTATIMGVDPYSVGNLKIQ